MLDDVKGVNKFLYILNVWMLKLQSKILSQYPKFELYLINWTNIEQAYEVCMPRSFERHSI